MMPFFCIHISQGSVATCLKRSRIFKHEFVANLLQNQVIISEVMANSLVSLFFFDSRGSYLQTLHPGTTEGKPRYGDILLEQNKKIVDLAKT